MAGQSQRDIKRRIRSVQSTQHITRAMQLVAAAKLRRVQGRALSGRPYAEKLSEVIARLARVQPGGFTHPLLEERPVKRAAYLVVTADRGLAGGYNANVVRLATDLIKQADYPCDIFVVGRRGRDALRKQQIPLAGEYVSLGDEIDWHDARDITHRLVGLYGEQKVDAIYLVYTEFVNIATVKPVVKQLLPIASLEVGKASEDTVDPGEYIYEPSPSAVLELLLPRYVETVVYNALMEARASEFGARTTAMRNATENAEEMVQELTVHYNRARQAGITREIAEIVGGANAQNGEGTRG